MLAHLLLKAIAPLIFLFSTWSLFSMYKHVIFSYFSKLSLLKFPCTINVYYNFSHSFYSKILWKSDYTLCLQCPSSHSSLNLLQSGSICPSEEIHHSYKGSQTSPWLSQWPFLSPYLMQHITSIRHNHCLPLKHLDFPPLPHWSSRTLCLYHLIPISLAASLSLALIISLHLFIGVPGSALRPLSFPSVLILLQNCSNLTDQTYLYCQTVTLPPRSTLRYPSTDWIHDRHLNTDTSKAKLLITPPQPSRLLRPQSFPSQQVSILSSSQNFLELPWLLFSHTPHPNHPANLIYSTFKVYSRSYHSHCFFCCHSNLSHQHVVPGLVQ